MANTSTTPASVESWMKDEEIETLAKKSEYDAIAWGARGRDELHYEYGTVAAVLRDYVRLRKLVNVVKAKTNEILRNEDSDGPFELVTGNGPMWIRDTSNRMQGPAMLTAVDAINAFVEIKRLLAEAEKAR